MTDTSSPYRESGLSARARQKRKKEPKVPSVYLPPGFGFGHYFEEDKGARKESVRGKVSAYMPATGVCKNCGKPRFAVETEKCEGRR